MTIYYSPSTKGFYDDKLKNDYQNNDSWPEDLTEISERWYNYLLQKQSEGKTININEYGQPVVTEPEPPTQEELTGQAERQKSKLLAEAESFILPLERAVKLGMATDAEREMLESWERYSVLLSRVDTANPEWPQKPE
ncbi:tail fiber assembly protein [Escherichia albertii]|uniref:Tail fiber assembly protein n=2 Tax=Escherichia TaxID=561 RepID=A0A765TD52_ECOLX|nr:tail fiber assembly protein [Escherichia albertii]EJZ4185253.1 tail fiber assembly protein [Escherichia coli]EEW0788181.1 phage tail protein [Escherichia albertii]EFB5190499.1 tail fiber assembly protein [Escherichia albertii]EGM7736472.1 tail fiber assembly protein [Escherichia albertii]EHK6582378.1 tail fiber assembly protein [Escherichia albertii]